MILSEPKTYIDSTLLVLTLGTGKRVHASLWGYEMAFHSADPAQLATWLRAGRGPTCPNDVALVDAVQGLIDNG